MPFDLPSLQHSVDAFLAMWIEFTPATKVLIVTTLYVCSFVLPLTISWYYLNIPLSDCISDEAVCYYALLTPALLPMLVLLAYLNWYGFMFFIHN